MLTTGLALLLTLPLLGLGRGEPAGAATSPTTTAGLSPLSDRRVVTGWIPYWDFADGVTAVVDNADVVAEISPLLVPGHPSVAGTAADGQHQPGEHPDDGDRRAAGRRRRRAAVRDRRRHRLGRDVEPPG